MPGTEISLRSVLDADPLTVIMEAEAEVADFGPHIKSGSVFEWIIAGRDFLRRSAWFAADGKDTEEVDEFSEMIERLRRRDLETTLLPTFSTYQ